MSYCGAPFVPKKCTWCPGPGDPCGLLDECCEGNTCDASFWGTCHPN
ncbi:Oxygen-independent coproporphyrinogen-III oxidase-like protein HemZ [Bienertia sinuspersici]